MSTHFNGEPLFFEKAPIVKLARTKLGDDPKQWEADILQVLHQQHPYLLDTNISINMKKIDAESGTGIGAIVLDGKVNVPIVIHNYRMAPLDVFLNDTEIVPLSRERIERTLKTMAIGKPVMPSKGEATDSSITHMTTPPYDGKYTFASNLSYTKAEFASAINHTYNETGFVLDLAGNDLWKEALNSYLTSAVEQEKVATSAPKYQLQETKKFEHQITKEAGIYRVPTSRGDKIGTLLHITEKLASTSPDWMFVSVDGSYIPLDTPNIPYKPTENIKLGSVATTDEGPGVFACNNGKLQVTDICTVLCKVGNNELLVQDSVGRQHRLVKSAEVDQIQVGGGMIIVPQNTIFLPAVTRVGVTHEKIANLIEDGPDTLTVTNQNSRLIFHSIRDWEFGDLLSKQGSYPDEVLNALSPYFDDQSLQLLLTIPKGQQQTFTVKTAAMTKVAELGKVPELDHEQLVAINHAAAAIDRRAADFLKIAANEARETVDTLLGLNFLNKSNLHKFVENMDKVGEARQVVGQLLIASRLGLDVDDAPLRTAFFALDEVEQDLQQLYNVTTVNN